MTLIDYFQDSDDTEATSSDTAWTTMLSTTLFLRRKNLIHISLEYGGDVTNRDVGVRVVVNGVERKSDYHEPSRTTASGGWKNLTFIQLVDTGESEVEYVVELQGIVESSPQILHIRRRSLYIMQQ